MSFQLTVLKVLAGQPDGQSSLEDLKRAVAILMTSGKDWEDRMRRLADQVPNLNIFSESYVVRNSDGWEITEDGRTFLRKIEAGASPPQIQEPSREATLDDVIAANEYAASRRAPDRSRARRRRRRVPKAGRRRAC